MLKIHLCVNKHLFYSSNIIIKIIIIWIKLLLFFFFFFFFLLLFLLFGSLVPPGIILIPVPVLYYTWGTWYRTGAAPPLSKFISSFYSVLFFVSIYSPNYLRMTQRRSVESALRFSCDAIIPFYWRWV